jgi:hypothetical protein
MDERRQHHLDLDSLIAWWTGEQDAKSEEAIELHLLGCGDCSRALTRLLDLRDGVRRAFTQGEVRAFVTAGFVARAAAAGLHIREYRVAVNGSVNCTVAPDDDLLVARLEAPLAGLTRLDVRSSTSGIEGVSVLEDVPFDSGADEIIITPSMSFLRSRSFRQRFELVAVSEGQERLIGSYTFHHSVPDTGAA